MEQYVHWNFLFDICLVFVFYLLFDFMARLQVVDDFRF
jgi:hypothetical protein